MSRFQAGNHFHNFSILRQLGEGGMGEVYEAFEPALNRRVALKLMSKKHSDDKEAVQRFIKEAQALGKLNHPNIVTVYQTGSIEDIHYISMELIDGRPLDEILSHLVMPSQNAINVIEQILQGTSYLHKNQIIHRDLKPSNILIQEGLKTKIVDFGIAKFMGDQGGDLTSASVIIGTPMWLAPELLLGQKATAQSDIWSIGAMAYLMLVGEHPIYKKRLGRGVNPAMSMDKFNNFKVEFPKETHAHVPIELRRIVLKMLNPNMQGRYKHCSQVLADLKNVNDAQLEHISDELLILPTNAEPQVKHFFNTKNISNFKAKRILLELMQSNIASNLIDVHRLTSTGIRRFDNKDKVTFTLDQVKEATEMYSKQVKTFSLKSKLSYFVAAMLVIAGMTLIYEDYSKNNLFLNKKGDQTFEDSEPSEKVEANNQEEESFKKVNKDTQPNEQTTSNVQNDLEQKQQQEKKPQRVALKPLDAPRLEQVRVTVSLEFERKLKSRELASKPRILNPPELGWVNVDGTFKYHVQISATNGFLTLLKEELTTGVRFKWEDARPGTYFFRVRSIGEDGYRSPFSSIGVLNVKVSPPVLPKTVIYKKEMDQVEAIGYDSAPNIVTWPEVPYANYYKVEIFDRRKNKVIRRSLASENSMSFIFSKKDILAFRVAVANKGGTPVSKFSKFALLKPEKVVNLKPPKISYPRNAITVINLRSQGQKTPFSFAWIKPKTAQGVIVELATDKKFDDVIHRETVEDKSRITIYKSIPPGRIFVRFKSFKEYFQSDWSNIKILDIK